MEQIYPVEQNNKKMEYVELDSLTTTNTTVQTQINDYNSLKQTKRRNRILVSLFVVCLFSTFAVVGFYCVTTPQLEKEKRINHELDIYSDQTHDMKDEGNNCAFHHRTVLPNNTVHYRVAINYRPIAYYNCEKCNITEYLIMECMYRASDEWAMPKHTYLNVKDKMDKLRKEKVLEKVSSAMYYGIGGIFTVFISVMSCLKVWK